jgi:chromosome segregation ATPase
MTDNRDDVTTQPTLTTLLERVQKAEAGLYQAIERLGLRIESEVQSVRGEVQSVREDFQSVRQAVQSLRSEVETSRRELHDEIQTLQEEMRTHFRKLETKFQLLIEDTMDVRANQRDLSKRMDELDVKAS